MGSGRLLLWAGIAVVAVDTLFFSGASNFLASPQARILHQFILLAVSVGVLVAIHRRAIDLGSPLMPAIALWVGATAISTTLSQRPQSSLEALGLLLLAAPVYLAVRATVWSPWLGPRVDRLLILTTFVFVIAYLGQAGSQWISWWSVAGLSMPPLRPGDVGLTVGTVNAVAIYLELLVPFAVWRSWMLWRSRAFTGALVLLSVAALVITGSRGAWIGATVAAGMLGFGLWWARGRPRRLPGTPQAWLMGVVAAAALVIATALLAPSLSSRLLSGDAGRTELWSAAWAMFLSSPVVGIGPGAWPALRPVAEISEPNLAVLITSHNSVLHVLAELGLVGFGAALSLVAVITRTALAAVRTVTGSERTFRATCAASLLAAGIHSLVDPQFHIPAIALMVLHLVARLDRPVQDQGASGESLWLPRWPAPVLAIPVLAGVLVLAPIDFAMVRAQLGNLLLDRRDYAGAKAEFEAAISVHDLGPYRLGLGIALAGLGDRPGADEQLARAEAIAPFTFITAARATVSSDAAGLLRLLETREAYDPTATVNAAVLWYPTARARAVRDLTAVMVAVPPLVYSQRPPELFDDQAWTTAQRGAVRAIGLGNPATASALARLAGLEQVADDYGARVPIGPEAEVLVLLHEATATGRTDIERARAILRASPTSSVLQGLLWMLAFEAGSQALLDDVRALSIPLRFDVPLPPMELVVHGSASADYSLRLPRYPMASDARQGPKRPYLPGMITIEPVGRPRH